MKVLCVGKIKESYLKEAILEYQKRLSRYVKLEIIEVPDACYDYVPLILEKERDLLLRYIGEKDYVITLEIDGIELSSLEFSKKLDSIFQSNITFVIGGSYGLHDDIKKRSNFALSFSKLTFPHQLFRVLLLEQIYRCYKIIHNESYHK